MSSQSLMDTYGEHAGTTVKVLCNKLTYAVARSLSKEPREGWLQSRWHWHRSPFSLRGQILWSEPLKAWFYVADELSIEHMLHMPDYEPVSWVTPKSGDVVIDVGAHTGWYAIQCARQVGTTGRVIALEPDLSNREQLERNLALNGIQGCKIVPLAAWSESGSIRWSSGDVSVWHRIDEEHGSGTMQTISLDEIASQLALSRVDWIKFDIEGAETKALEGARHILEEFRPALFIEIHQTLQPVKSVLGALGYSVEKAEFDEAPDRHGWILARATGGS